MNRRLARVKTSVTLPPDLLVALDHFAKSEISRSRLIEEAIRDLLARRTKAERDARDLEILDGNAQRLNAEAADVLEYQVGL